MTTKQLERLKLALVLLLNRLRSKKGESILSEELPLETSRALTTHNTNTIATRSIKGMSGNNNLPSKEKIAEPIAAVSAPLAVTPGDTIPSKKIATIPGVKKPVNSWIY